MLQATAGKIEKWPPSIAKQTPIQIWYISFDRLPYSFIVKEMTVRKNRMTAYTLLNPIKSYTVPQINLKLAPQKKLEAATLVRYSSSLKFIFP